jgi:hypothetical protein
VVDYRNCCAAYSYSSVGSSIENPGVQQSQEKVNNSDDVQIWIQYEENASSPLISVFGDNIVNDLMNELADPVAMWNVLEGTHSSKIGTNILTILNCVVPRNLEEMSACQRILGNWTHCFTILG